MSGMITMTLKFQTPLHPEIEGLLGKVQIMGQKAVGWFIANKKTALAFVHADPSPPFASSFLTFTATGFKAPLRQPKALLPVQKAKEKQPINIASEGVKEFPQSF